MTQKYHVWYFYSDLGGGDRLSWAQIQADSLDDVINHIKPNFPEGHNIEEDGDEESLTLSITYHPEDCECGEDEDCDNYITEGYQIELVDDFVSCHAPPYSLVN